LAPAEVYASLLDQGVYLCSIQPCIAFSPSMTKSANGAGREGPIAQIGASFGSWLGQIIGMAPWQRVTLVAAGAGAGIAATFNTPIGGVMFAVELMMPELSARRFLPVAIPIETAEASDLTTPTTGRITPSR
jgi:voltage-gated chloride channel